MIATGDRFISGTSGFTADRKFTVIKIEWTPYGCYHNDVSVVVATDPTGAPSGNSTGDRWFDVGPSVPPAAFFYWILSALLDDVLIPKLGLQLPGLIEFFFLSGTKQAGDGFFRRL